MKLSHAEGASCPCWEPQLCIARRWVWRCIYTDNKKLNFLLRLTIRPRQYNVYFNVFNARSTNASQVYPISPYLRLSESTHWWELEQATGCECARTKFSSTNVKLVLFTSFHWKWHFRTPKVGHIVSKLSTFTSPKMLELAFEFSVSRQFTFLVQFFSVKMA